MHTLISFDQAAHMEIVWLVVVIAVFILVVYIQNVNYRLGVGDGYGYAREPWNPGYQVAGTHLRKNFVHRWPELGVKITRDDDGGYHSVSANESDFGDVESTAPGTIPHIHV